MNFRRMSTKIHNACFGRKMTRPHHSFTRICFYPSSRCNQYNCCLAVSMFEHYLFLCSNNDYLVKQISSSSNHQRHRRYVVVDFILYIYDTKVKTVITSKGNPSWSDGTPMLLAGWCRKLDEDGYFSKSCWCSRRNCCHLELAICSLAISCFTIIFQDMVYPNTRQDKKWDNSAHLHIGVCLVIGVKNEVGHSML